MKIKLFLVLIISVLFIYTNISAGSLNFSYTYVKTDSYPEYTNAQYANNYDNVDLKVSLNLVDQENEAMPIVLSPVIYGITSLGDLEFLYAIPNQTVYLYPHTTYYKTFNNIFYTSPEYVAYRIVVNAHSLDNIYSNTDSAYVYRIDNYTYPDFPNEENDTENQQDLVSCSDFSISGQTDIYLDEDEEKSYKLYLSNNSNQELNIISITTNDASELGVVDIDYPYSINSNSTRYAQLDLVTDTVSSDYSSNFDITVNAKFGELNCLKTYTVNYHIANEELNSHADCSDILFENTDFVINNNSDLIKEITIRNNSLDYYYDIEDIDIENTNNLSVEVRDFPSKIYEDDKGIIRLKLNTNEVIQDTVENLKLEVNGYMKRQGREDKHCRKIQNIKINIKKEENNYSHSTNCNDIKIYTSNISQLKNTSKNYSEEDGFFIINNSNKRFDISSILVSDNSSNIELSKNNINSLIYPQSRIPLNLKLKTHNVSETEHSLGSISLKGSFFGGGICEFSDIKKEFNITVLNDEKNSCSNVGVKDQEVINGINYIEIYNNTSENFIINDTLVQNKYNLNIETLENTKTIEADSTAKLKVNVSGDGSAEILLKGKFNSGESCDFLDTTSGVLVSTNSFDNQNQEDINFSDVDECSFVLDIPSLLEIKNAVESFNLSFINSSYKAGQIQISGNGAVLSPSIIYLNGYDDFTKEITVSNFDNPSIIFYKVKLNGCDEKLFFTNLSESLSPSKKILITSYPLEITPSKNTVNVSLVLENNYNIEKDIKLKLSGFPVSWKTKERKITLEGNTKKVVNLNIKIPDDENNLEYHGKIELYLNNSLLSSSPLVINLSKVLLDPISIDIKVDSSDLKNTYLVNLNIKNNYNTQKYLFIDFNLSHDWIIDGDKNITLLPNQDLNLKYKIVSPYKLIKDYNSQIYIRDRVSNDIIKSKEVLFYPLMSNTTGLFIFSTAEGIVGFIIFIFIILVLIYLIKKKRKIKEEKNKSV